MERKERREAARSKEAAEASRKALVAEKQHARELAGSSAGIPRSGPVDFDAPIQVCSMARTQIRIAL